MKFLFCEPIHSYDRDDIFVIEDYISFDFVENQILNHSRSWIPVEYKSVSEITDQEIIELLEKEWSLRNHKYKWGKYEGPGAFVEYEVTLFRTTGLPEFISGLYLGIRDSYPYQQIMSLLETQRKKN